MFHLFRKAYLVHDFRYTSQFDGMIASENYLKDPLIDNVMGSDTVHRSDTLAELIEKRFENNIEKLWAFLFETAHHKRFHFYVDEKAYNQLQIQYWKSTFVNLDFSTCYLLHKLYVQDLKLKSGFQQSKLNKSQRNYLTEVQIQNELDYKELFEETQALEFISRLNLEERSFEWLLARYLLKPHNLEIHQEFLSKLKHFSWEMLVDEIDILRSEVLNGIYDYLNNESEFNQMDVEVIDSLDSIVQLVRANEKIMWVIDQEISAKNYQYILKTYNPKTFVGFIGYEFGISIKDQKTPQNEEVQAVFDYVFNEKYIELLEVDIKTGFGSLFFTGKQKYQVNLLLIAYLYDMARKGTLETLTQFEVKENGF